MNYPAVIKQCAGFYTVRGASGNKAGTIEKMSKGWLVQLHCMPPQIFETFRSGAKPSALEDAKRY